MISFGAPRTLRRYFLVLGILSFATYLFQLHRGVSLVLAGPAMFISIWIKKFLYTYIPLPASDFIYNFFFMLPVTLLYYLGIGFLLKKLWQEQGIVRTVTILALVSFLVYLHFSTYQSLITYLTPIGTELNAGAPPA